MNHVSTAGLMARPFVRAGGKGEIVFLFIGGAHQLFHLAPVAASLARLCPDLRVTCVHQDDATGRMLRDVRANMGARALRIDRIDPPRWVDRAARLLNRPSLRKLPLLRRIARRYHDALAIVSPERTSAWLRRLGMADARLIHFRHGAGDRSPRSEKRLDAFDLIVLPGDKDVARAVHRHGIDRTKLRRCGYVKLDYLAQHGTGQAARLFGDDRPVVLYNPHFDPRLSSWADAQAVIDAFARQDRYNLVMAPHIRLGANLSEAERKRWRAMAVPGRIIVDLESDRLVDMHYVLAADIYLGDVSSQLYEFLARPRPVAFLNSHGVDWRADQRYAGWHLGVVADRPASVIDAIDDAVAAHPARLADQQAAVTHAFGTWHGAADRGARIVAHYLGAPVVGERAQAVPDQGRARIVRPVKAAANA
jgi:hypothetical protein